MSTSSTTSAALPPHLAVLRDFAVMEQERDHRRLALIHEAQGAGHSTAAIADALGVTRQAVEGYLKRRRAAQ